MDDESGLRVLCVIGLWIAANHDSGAAFYGIRDVLVPIGTFSGKSNETGVDATVNSTRIKSESLKGGVGRPDDLSAYLCCYVSCAQIQSVQLLIHYKLLEKRVHIHLFLPIKRFDLLQRYDS